MAKVFLSHSAKDSELVGAVHAHLADRHHELFLDHDPGDGIPPGADWERTLYERLQWADALVGVVTRNYTESRWCFAEVALAKAQGRLIVPLAAEEGIVHPLLAAGQHVAYAADATGALARLVDRLAAIDAGGGVAWDPRRAVFPGLVAFDTDDRAMFFGRDREIRELVKEIRARMEQRQPRALIVFGSSGSGKSSLVRAGLLPQILEDSAWWRLRPFMPGDAPLAALAEALARGRKEVGLAHDLDGLRRQLPAGLTQLAREILLEARGDRRHLLITVDQLEEVFTRAGDADRRTFLTALAAAATEPDGPISIVATIRSEFLSELLRLPEATLLRERPFLLAPLGREHLEDVITKPALKAQIAFEPTVVRRLVDDTGSGEALPLLAFTLARLVETLNRGSRVDLARYEAIGGVRGSLESQAETALFAALTKSGCTEVEVVTTLMGFVTLDDSGRPMRRRRRRADLAPAAASVIDVFVQARLLTTHTDDNIAFVGVAHETLFSAWGRMATAIAATCEDLRRLGQMRSAAAEWDRQGRRGEYLWPDKRLMPIWDVITRLQPELNETEERFVRPFDRNGVLDELNDPATSHERRAAIGDYLAQAGDTRPGVGVGGDGLPDIAWCDVPGGEISLDGVTGTYRIESFQISKYPTTWVQYRTFVEASDGYKNTDWWEQLDRHDQRPGEQYRRLDNHPAENVSWCDAVAFCRWLTVRFGYEVRLPPEWEWQQAAMGGRSGIDFPWGAAWDSRRANTAESGLNRTTAVGMYPDGASPIGALDLSGNVWQWCLNEYETPDRVELTGDKPRVVRGGSFFYKLECGRAAYRDRDLPNWRNLGHGFRLVRFPAVRD